MDAHLRINMNYWKWAFFGLVCFMFVSSYKQSMFWHKQIESGKNFYLYKTMYKCKLTRVFRDNEWSGELE